MSTSRKKVDTSQQDVKKKMTILGVLSSLVALVLVYQYFAASNLAPVKEPPNPDAKYQNRIPANQLAANNAKNSQDPKAQDNDQILPAMLDFSSLENRDNGSSDGIRNPFEYPPPPPPPPPIPAKPATIRINTLNPQSVYAKTKGFEVVIRGANLTDDMMIYLSGNPGFSKTVFVSDSEVRASVPENYFTNPGQLSFQVKRRGQEADHFSNTLNLNILTPKDPSATFKMVGQFTDTEGKVCAVLSEGDTKPTQIIKLGSTVTPSGNPPDSTTWEVISIGKYEVGLKDIKQAIGVTWPVRMKADSTIAGSSTGLTYNPYQNSSYESPYVENGNSYTDAANAINLTDALQNQNATSAYQTSSESDPAKQQQQNFKVMNELMQKQREAIMRQQQELRQKLQNQQPPKK